MDGFYFSKKKHWPITAPVSSLTLYPIKLVKEFFVISIHGNPPWQEHAESEKEEHSA